MSLEKESCPQLIGHMSIPCSNDSVLHPASNGQVSLSSLPLLLVEPDEAGVLWAPDLRFLLLEPLLDLGVMSESSSESHGLTESRFMFGKPASLSLPVCNIFLRMVEFQ